VYLSIGKTNVSETYASQNDFIARILLDSKSGD